MRDPSAKANETSSHAAANVLGGLLAQVAIQRLRIAVERGAVMPGIKRRLSRNGTCSFSAQELAATGKGTFQSWSR